MKTVIMAGGEGKRIRELFPDIPKPLIPIEGKPVLWHTIQQLKKYQFTDIIITVGYMADRVMSYFGNGSEHGVHLEYYVEEKPLGSAGALFQMKEDLSEDFLLLNGDMIFDVALDRFAEFHKKHGGRITVLTHPNTHPYDSTLIAANPDGLVTDWITKEKKREKWYKNRVNAGIHMIRRDALSVHEKREEKLDLDRDVIAPRIEKKEVFCYDSCEYVKDMGTPERYKTVCEDLRKGRVKERNYNHKRKAIFLDRDGTINVYKGFLTETEQFELLPDAAEAIHEINESGYLAIVVTNQPVIARGEVSEQELDTIHNKMETLLGEQGAYLDGLYYCPHHPDRGYAGEIEELKIDCDCRKPKPGMLLRAAEDFNISLSESWMIGDGKRDMEAGNAAGCNTILIGNHEYGQLRTVGSLLDAVHTVLMEDAKKQEI